MGEWSEREVMYVAYAGIFKLYVFRVKFPNPLYEVRANCPFLSGELFLRMLKALILPLVVPSLITAVGSLDLSLSGKVGQRQIHHFRHFSENILTALTVSTIFS